MTSTHRELFRRPLLLGTLGVLLSLIPYAGSTGVRALDEILFSPLAALVAVAGFALSLCAVVIGLRERHRLAPKLAMVCGTIGILLAVAAFWV